MKRILIASLCALALAACDRTGQAPAADEAAQEQGLVLSCDAFRDASAATLAAAYGAGNLVDQVVPGPEGEDYTATVLFPNDAARRLEITWRDESARVGPASLAVRSEGSMWTGPNGVALGQTVAEVETANGRAFMLYGFEWDYGGRVSNWNGGTFAAANGCNTSVGFLPRSETATGAMGDSEFSSDDPAVRARDAVVAEFSLVFAVLTE